jgi:hypothetical protein
LGKISTAIAVVLLAIAGFAYWMVHSEHEKRKEAELQLGLESSKIINVSFQQRSDLTVYRLSGDVVSKVDCEGRIFHPEQRTKAPVKVSYSLPLSAINRSAYTWSQGQQRLTISIPDVRVETPNVDISRKSFVKRGDSFPENAGSSWLAKRRLLLLGVHWRRLESRFI